MYKSRFPWQYSLFQIPALLLATCLVLAGIAAFLGFGCPDFWTRLFLGLSWIAFTWMLVLPLDNFLRSKLNIGMGLAGRLAFFHAVLWSIATLVVLASGLPTLMQSCTSITSQPTTPTPSPTPTPTLTPTPSPTLTPTPTPTPSQTSTPSPDPSLTPTPTPSPTPTPTRSIDRELISLDWSRWRANIWNQMFLNQPPLGSIGSKAEFSFVIYRDGHIEDIQVKTEDDPSFKKNVISRIMSLEGTDALVFLESTRRDTVPYESEVTVCTPGSSPGCNEPADPSDFDDKEKYTRPRS